MKTKQILATFAWMAAIMMAVTFTSCTKTDNPAGHNPINDDEATLVTNDAELRSAISNGASILLACDIQLSNSTLSIPEGTTVTINMAGFTLDRNLTKRGEGGGQVITIRKGATLHLSNGTLKGGWGGDSGGINNEGGTAYLTNVTITGCTGDDRGGGICNRSGSTLTMKGGSITNNTSNDHGDPTGGGGIFNADGATMTLTDVTISGNKTVVYGGGGICNYGTLTISGCTIQNNIVKTVGGGIWNKGVLNMKDKNIVTENTATGGITDNLYLKKDITITVIGALNGSKIGVSMENPDNVTSDYNAYHPSTDPSEYFIADMAGVMDISLEAGEAKLVNALHEGEVYYYERSWNADTKTLTSTLKTRDNVIGYDAIPDEDDYKLVTNASGDDWFALGGFNNDIHEYYVVTGEVKHNTLNVLGKNVHLILCDGAMLTLSGGILVYGDRKLYIHSQSYDSKAGKLIVLSGYNDKAAGIGSDNGDADGFYTRTSDIEIHGGAIFAEGGTYAAGIGGGYNQHGGSVVIYGGQVEARGGDGDITYDGGSGIGGGASGGCGHVTIYDGRVAAFGGDNSAGIGTGNNIISINDQDKTLTYDDPDDPGEDEVISYVGVVDIYGGYIEAHGGKNAAGIGGGNSSNGIFLTMNDGEVYAYGGDDGAGIGGGWGGNGGSTTVNGGYVYAKGAGNGAGIGSGSELVDQFGVQGGSLTVTGGSVEAYGGDDAAGIGGGEDADGGTVNISGGSVYAKGRYAGAGIGGGESGDGAKVTITGGTVHASAGSGDTGNRAIGPGYGCDNYGELTLGDLLMVRAERMANADERVPMCWYRTDVHVEPCTHPGYTAETCPYHKH